MNMKQKMSTVFDIAHAWLCDHVFQTKSRTAPFHFTFIYIAFPIQFLFNDFNCRPSHQSTYHHVTGSDDVGASTSLGDGLFAELVDGNIVEDLAILDDAVVALIGVGIQGDVGTNDTVGVLLLDHADGTVDDAIGVVGLDAEVCLELIGDLGEEDERLDAEVVGLTNLSDHGVEGVTLAAGHGGDCGVEVLFVDEEGIDKVGGGNDVFPEHGANSGRLAVAARTGSLGDPDVVLVVARESSIVSGGGVEHVMSGTIINSLQGVIDGGGGISVGSDGREGIGRSNESSGDGESELHLCKRGQWFDVDRIELQKSARTQIR